MAKPSKKEWVDWQNTKVLQKAIIVDEDGNILTLRRIENGFGKRLGKWDLPGGSIEPKDLVSIKPATEAIKREILEETSLEILDLEAIFIDSWVFTKSIGPILGIAIGYKCKVKGIKPEVKLSHEHIESKWGLKEKIAALDFGDDGGLHLKIIQKL